MKNNRKNRKLVIMRFKTYYLSRYYPVRRLNERLKGLNQALKKFQHLKIAAYCIGSDSIEITFRRKKVLKLVFYLSINKLFKFEKCQKCGEEGLSKNPFTMCANCAVEFENDFVFDIMAATNALQNKKLI